MAPRSSRLALPAPLAALALGWLACGCGPEADSVAESGVSPEEGNSVQADLPLRTEDGLPPHVVLVLIDTLRSDHLATYGYEEETAPFLSELADQALVFERAYSTSSWTAPSTASLFTGLYPPRHGVTTGFRAQSKKAGKKLPAKKQQGPEVDHESELIDLVSMPASLQTLPELFQAAGYQTFGVAANINIGEPLGFRRGFDRFSLQHDDVADELVETVRGWREELRSGEPSFLYLHFNDVHKPYRKREPWFEPRGGGLNDLRARYDSEIRYVDEELRRLSAELGWERDTIVVVLSDHGEEFEDHGQRGHQFTLYRELNQVVCLLRVPGIAAQRVSTHVSLVDVLPTLLELTGVRRSKGFDTEQAGRSLVTLMGESQAAPSFAERTLFAHRNSIREQAPLWAAIQGRWKLIANDASGEELLFDLVEDKAETNNLLEAQPEIVARLRAELEAFREVEPMASAAGLDIEVDAELRAHLETLGYVGGDQ